MKKLYTTLFLLILFAFSAAGQKNVTISDDQNYTADPSAVLDIHSAEGKGLLVPRVNEQQLKDIQNPATGLLIYLTSDNKFYYYDGNQWVPIPSDVPVPDRILDNDEDTGVYVEKSNDEDIIRFETEGSQKMMLDKDGSLGIGIPDPGYVLDVKHNGVNPDGVFRFGVTGVSEPVLIAKTNGTIGVGINNPLAALHINETVSGNKFLVGEAAAPRLVIKENGRIGIGIALPGALLDIKSTGLSPFRVDAGDVSAVNVSSTGLVGIGENSPAAKLHIEHASGSPFRVSKNGSAKLAIDDDGQVGINTTVPSASLDIRGSNGDAFLARTGNTVRMAVKADGKVGINTAAPNSTLHINGTVSKSIKTIAANYEIGETDYTVVYNGGQNGTVTLPSPAGITGRIYNVVKKEGSIIVKTVPGSSIYGYKDGISLWDKGAGATFQSDGTDWLVINLNLTN